MSLHLPVIRGVITRRLLVNFRIDPAALRAVLPAPFRPQLVRGYALGGICLIRLDAVRPAALPGWLGLGSENAAHRFAVEWDEAGGTHSGVYIPRRDTGSALNQLLGGRVFPGEHHRADFTVNHEGESLRLQVRGRDHELHLEVSGRTGREVASGSVLRSLAQASDFFHKGPLGWSAARNGCCEGLALRCDSWRMEPFAVESVTSSFFDDVTRFPAGSVEFDGAFIMRGIEHEWRAHGTRKLEAWT